MPQARRLTRSRAGETLVQPVAAGEALSYAPPTRTTASDKIMCELCYAGWRSLDNAGRIMTQSGWPKAWKAIPFNRVGIAPRFFPLMFAVAEKHGLRYEPRDLGT